MEDSLTHLSELYTRKTGFPAYRKESLRSITDAPEAEALRTLKAKRVRMNAEIDAEIAKLKYKLATQGTVLSKTARKIKRTEELTAEKQEIDRAFAVEVKERLAGGATVAQLAQECGATSYSIFYQAQAYADPETVELNTKFKTFDPSLEAWEYLDYTNLHRYAVNTTRTVFRLHDPADADMVVYIRRADQEVVGGYADLKSKFDPKRAEEMVSALDDPNHDTSKYRTRENPYRLTTLEN